MLCLYLKRMRHVYIQNNTPYKLNSRYYANNIADARLNTLFASLSFSPLGPLRVDGFEIPELYQEVIRDA